MGGAVNVQDAAYHTVHDYPGGSESLGPRVKISPAVLRSKVNPNTVTHHLTLHEAQRIQAVTDDHRILHAMCAELNYLPPIPAFDFDGVSDEALLEMYTGLVARLGEFSQKFHSVLSDGRVSRGEVVNLTQSMREFQGAGEALLARVRTLVED